MSGTGSDPGRIIRILSVDGGGFLGLASASAIHNLETHFGTRFADRFDLFCGTSTGSIVCLGLAGGRTGERIVELYSTLGREVFGSPRFLRGLVGRAKHDNRAFRAALQAEFRDETLGSINARGKRALITAFNLSSGSPRVFKTNHCSEYTTDDGLSLVDVVLASCAAPVYLPSVRIQNPTTKAEDVFCDGGVAANQPALLGFVEAISILGFPPAQVRILSLGTPRIRLAEDVERQRTLDRSAKFWVKSLPAIFIDAGASLAHEVLRRLVDSYPTGHRPRYARVDLDNHAKLEMDTVDAEAARTLIGIGAAAAARPDVRALVRKVLDEEGDNG